MLCGHMTDKTSQSQPRFTFLFNEPKYEVFFREFLSANVPCILSCGVTDCWNACKDWVDDSGKPDLHDLCQKLGELCA